MAITVPRDNVVSEGMRGVAADWGPFHSSRKREDMRSWVRDQSYCAAPVPQTRPVLRPVRLEADTEESAETTAAGAEDLTDASRPLPRP